VALPAGTAGRASVLRHDHDHREDDGGRDHGHDNRCGLLLHARLLVVRLLLRRASAVQTT
jgi:hypothetical protein